jgi:uncharacterized protein YndB with AHSA1/START domain
MTAEPAMTGPPLTASIHVQAPPERVFEHFTRPAAIVAWMGEHATLDPRPGGEFSVDIRGVPVRGRYLEVDPPHRLLISWGHAGSARLPPGASLLEVRFQPTHDGTMVSISHRGLPEPEATGHQHGWTQFLSQLATAARHGRVSETSDGHPRLARSRTRVSDDPGRAGRCPR